MLVQHIAMVAQTVNLGISELTQVSAAIQTQVSRDLSPIWSINATVDSFQSLEDVPQGYWIISITDKDLGKGLEGYHQDQNGQPFALIHYDDEWTVSAAHEIIEMLVDPFGQRLVAGPSPKPDQGEVSFLVEACDPSQNYTYVVNGIKVSDFFTPHFFDPVESTNSRYSYMGVITKPRQVMPGGYMSWYDPVSASWWQQYVNEAGQSEFVQPDLQASGMSARAGMDAFTRKHLQDKGQKQKLMFSPKLEARALQNNRWTQMKTASKVRAKAFTEYLNTLVKTQP